MTTTNPTALATVLGHIRDERVAALYIAALAAPPVEAPRVAVHFAGMAATGKTALAHLASAASGSTRIDTWTMPRFFASMVEPDLPLILDGVQNRGAHSVLTEAVRVLQQGADAERPRPTSLLAFAERFDGGVPESVRARTLIATIEPGAVDGAALRQLIRTEAGSDLRAVFDAYRAWSVSVDWDVLRAEAIPSPTGYQEEVLASAIAALHAFRRFLDEEAGRAEQVSSIFRFDEAEDAYRYDLILDSETRTAA